jgi:enoyl-CoA hydratase/carnithine racemase
MAESCDDGTINVRVTDDGVARIELDRPARLNTLTERLVQDFHRALDDVTAAGARALVVTGTGRAFCAGRDLTEAVPGEDAEAVVREVFNPLVLRLAGFEIPTLAGIQGACLGAGLGIALACDVVVVEAQAKLGSPYRRLGAVLDVGLHDLMASRIGRGRTLELVYTGELVTGQEAARLGLVNRAVTGHDELASELTALAQHVAAGPTLAFRESKAIMRHWSAGASFEAVLDMEARAQGRAAQTADYQEGLAAFRLKRAPQFRGA